MDTYFSVYQTTNLVNGKTYIGAHKTCDPWDNYLGSGKTLKGAVQKHGRQSFTKEVLAVFDNPEDMWATEKRLVNEAFVSRQDTYNICLGGLGGNGTAAKGRLVSVETRQKLSLAHRGRARPKHSEETKQKISLGNLNRPPISEETRQKMSLAWIGRVVSEETKRKQSEIRKKAGAAACLKATLAWKGKLHTEESKAKMRGTRRPHSEEHKAKISAARKGVKKTGKSKSIAAF